MEIIIVLKVDDHYKELEAGVLSWALWSSLKNGQVLVETGDFYTGNKKVGQFINDDERISVRKLGRRNGRRSDP